METNQIKFWTGDFGKEYTDRNSRSQNEWDQFYLENYGITKVDMNQQFIGAVDKSAKILEVGCNTGMQLAGLQRMGFENLYGIEIQAYAVQKAKEFTQNINIIQGSGFDIPFKDNYFDIVCTNGVLIHIDPNDLPLMMAEMVRCTKKYIWGFEYHADSVTNINYRGNEGFLWKADYSELFLKNFKNLKLVKKTIYPFVKDAEKGNKDCMYLLEKIS
jgi:pseudaminic acid biosynthesis-associated methylase